MIICVQLDADFLFLKDERPGIQTTCVAGA